MMTIVRTVTISLGIVALTAAFCSAVYSASVGDVATDSIRTRARIAKLEADARALAKTKGCSAASQCRTAPVGSKACGGPRTYLVYCAASTDSVTLFKKLDALKSAEERYNKNAGLASTCEYRMPPGVSVQRGVCQLRAGEDARGPR
jgi:hypothetical protein